VSGYQCRNCGLNNGKDNPLLACPMCQEAMSAYCSQCKTSYTASNAGTKCWCGGTLVSDFNYRERIESEERRVGLREESPRPRRLTLPTFESPQSVFSFPIQTSTSTPKKEKTVPVPKIIHCTWAGGGPIEKTKRLEGIQSWIDNTDYEVWIWWDDAHQYNMHTRQFLRPTAKGGPKARAQYELSLREDPHGIRSGAKGGRDIHNLRFLSRGMTPEEKLALAIGLVQDSFTELEPLRKLELRYPDRIRLCNVRDDEFLRTLKWVNQEAYDLELTARGMFAAAASDILRYEVLYNFGGMYLDVDIVVNPPGLEELRVEHDGLLAAITPDKAGDARAKARRGSWSKILPAPYDNRCLYLSNCAMAAAKGSRLVDTLRQTIRMSYQLAAGGNPQLFFKLDRHSMICRYWTGNITRSTLDLTGPNLVRDILWMKQTYVDWKDMPELCVTRLIDVLSEKPGLINNVIKDVPEPYSRVAYVWRDDDEQHEEFWDWVEEHASFNMKPFVLDTPGAIESDCKKAGMQKLKSDTDDEALGADFGRTLYFPNVKVNQTIKGTAELLQKEHKQLRPLPPDLEEGTKFEWGFVFWEVTSKAGGKLTLKRLSPQDSPRYD
jgi:hypothetical protein